MPSLGAQVPSLQHLGDSSGQQPTLQVVCSAEQPAGPLAQLPAVTAQVPSLQQKDVAVGHVLPEGQQVSPAARHLPLQQEPEVQTWPAQQTAPLATQTPPQQKVPAAQQEEPHGSCPTGQRGGSGGIPPGLEAQGGPAVWEQVPSGQQ